MLIRKGFASGQLMVCLIINGKKLPEEQRLAEELWKIPGMTSVSVNVNMERTNVIMGKKVRVLKGEEKIEDSIGDVVFRISPLSFYQVNPAQTEKLYGLALKYAQLSGHETVWDLYCGIGTISLFLAQQAREVQGVEIVPQAIEDARRNAERNSMENVEFLCADAGAAAAALAQRGIRPDCIVVDPPRKGMYPEAIDVMVSMQPPRIVYVSCDPATLARDVKRFAQAGYAAVRAAAVDMFPSTANVETVCLLSKLQSKEHIEIEVKMDELDLTSAESKATYEEIREYIFEHTGLKVSYLYIAQVKQKYGIIERENYNKPKSENAKQPQCPPEKERAITEALKHFEMI